MTHFQRIKTSTAILFFTAGLTAAQYSPDKVFLTSELETQATKIMQWIEHAEYDKTILFLNQLKTGMNKTVDGLNALDVLLTFTVNYPALSPLAEQWLSNNSNSTYAHLLLGDRRRQEAWAARGGNYSQHVGKSNYQIFQETLREAENHLTKAYQLDPNNYIAACRMISVVMGLSSGKDECNRWFKRAVSQDPSYYEPYDAKARFLYPRWYGSEKEALSFIEQSMPIDKRMLLLKFEYIYAHNATKLNKSHSKVSKTSLTLIFGFQDAYPKSTVARAWLATLNCYWGNTEKALSLATTAVEQDPSSENFRLVAFYLHYYLKRYDEALSFIEKATRLNPNNTNYWALEARIHHDGLQNHAEAIKAYTKSMKLKSGQYNLLNRRGDCYYETGQLYEAVADYKAALAIKPSHQGAKKGLQLTYEHMDKSNVPRERPKK